MSPGKRDAPSAAARALGRLDAWLALLERFARGERDVRPAITAAERAWAGADADLPASTREGEDYREAVQGRMDDCTARMIAEHGTLDGRLDAGDARLVVIG